MSHISKVLKFSLSGIFLALVLIYPLADRSIQPNNNFPSLRAECPPGFKKNKNNECISVNLYQLYESPNDKGVGGLQTSLPEIRDGRE